jgi:protease I
MVKAVRHFAGKAKRIAAICHGIQILTAADMLEGKSCTAYPAIRPEITSVRGKYVDIPMDCALVDGNLITALDWPAHPQWLAKFL